MNTRTIDRKGILTYLLITFGISYAIELALILSGFRADGVPQISRAICEHLFPSAPDFFPPQTLVSQ
jgi:hypothetical protein